MKPAIELFHSILWLIALVAVFLVITYIRITRGHLVPGDFVDFLNLGVILLYGAIHYERINHYLLARKTDLPVISTPSGPEGVISQEQAIALAKEHLNDAYCPLKLQKLVVNNFAVLKRNWSGSRYVWQIQFVDQNLLHQNMRNRFESNTVEIEARTGEVISCTWDAYYAREVKVSPARAIAIARKYAVANGWSSAESSPALAELHLGRYPTVEYEPGYIGMPISLIWWSVYLNIGGAEPPIRVDVFARENGTAFNIQAVSVNKSE